MATWSRSTGAGRRGGEAGPLWLCSVPGVWEGNGELSTSLCSRLTPLEPGRWGCLWVEEREDVHRPRSSAISVTQNTSAASHREGQILGTGLECKGPGGGGSGGGGGELRFHLFWQIGGPL